MTSTFTSFGLFSSVKQEDAVTKMQSIVSILGTDSERLKNPCNSLRRTLSADMSSRKWLSQHGLKKIASSDNISVSTSEYFSSSSSSSSSLSSDGDEEGYDHDHCSKNKSQFETENQSQFDIWSSIILQKKQEDSNNVEPTYVHPLVRRSSSSLSDKSLQICTESLGSESGSDGFSPYTPSKTSDAEEEPQQQQQQVLNTNKYDVEEVKYNNLAASTKKTTPKSFPPPISSLSSHRDGTSVLMKSHRDNGRLVLEAVSVPSHNNFRAERQDGRLVLTLIDGPEEEIVENEEDQFEVEDEMKFLMEKAPLLLSSGIISVHRLAKMVDKTIMFANKNPKTWTNQAKSEERQVEMVDETSVVAMTQSLPPRPAMARPKPGLVSFNPYECYWKHPIIPKTHNLNTSLRTKNSRNNLNKMVYVVENCKEEKMSVLCLESYCIATSSR